MSGRVFSSRCRRLLVYPLALLVPVIFYMVLSIPAWADCTLFDDWQPEKKAALSFTVDGVDFSRWCEENRVSGVSSVGLAERLAGDSYRPLDSVYLDEKVFQAVFNVKISRKRARLVGGADILIHSGNESRYREYVIVSSSQKEIRLFEGGDSVFVNREKSKFPDFHVSAYASTRNGHFYLPAKWLANQLGGDFVFVEGRRCDLVSKSARDRNENMGSESKPIVSTVWTDNVVSSEETWTACSFRNAVVRGTNGGLAVEFEWQIYNVKNPSEIDQVFIALDDKILATVYDGIPGKSPGHTGVFQKQLSLPKIDGRDHTLYVVRTAATSESAGKRHYQEDSGGWKAPIARIAGR